jgi:D-lactate dehydrogenase
MKIVCYETADWEAAYLKQKLAGFDMEFIGGSKIQPNPDAEIVCNFVGSPLTAEIIAQMPKLKFVATRSTGFDHIDLKACAERGIAVSNVPTYGENTVAEFAFALILSLSRKIYPAYKRVREQGLFSTNDLQGFDLQGKTLGVVGAGHIGQFVIKIAKGFGMNVVAYDPYPKRELADKYQFVYASLEDVLKQSDVITLHVPYMPATHHLINSQNISLCKKGCIIINTARGGLIETAALVKALKSGQIAGAGLDVLEEEGFIKEEVDLLVNGHPNEDELKTALADHELMYMDNVLITPHNAFNTKEAMVRILDTTVGNIKGFEEGKLVNLVSGH